LIAWIFAMVLELDLSVMDAVSAMKSATAISLEMGILQIVQRDKCGVQKPSPKNMHANLKVHVHVVNKVLTILCYTN